MPRVSESERLQHAHTMWRLASQRAASEITDEEYEQRFWALLKKFGYAFDFRSLAPITPPSPRPP